MSQPVEPRTLVGAALRHRGLRPSAILSAPAGDAVDPMPVRPSEPEADECCGEGCVPCVFDRHEQALERYRLALAAWQERHPERAGGD